MNTTQRFKSNCIFCFLKNYQFVFFCLLQLFIFSLESAQIQNNIPSNYAIVFVHIGDSLPIYINEAIKQARLFNPNCPIILVANQNALDKQSDELKNQELEAIACESLHRTSEHEQLCNNSPGRDGFWFFTTERLLYIYDLMEQYQLHNVFHLENDNMLYADLETMLPLFENKYQGIAATFDNNNRCIAGFMYIHTNESMKNLAAFIADKKNAGNDMELIAKFKNNSSPELIDSLPIIHKEYTNKYSLRSPCGFTTNDPPRYYNHVEDFAALFDAAAIGQYLGGIHSDPTPGFINESCLFNPSVLTYVWEEDSYGRKVPFAIFDEVKYPIVNLHIHAKKLWKFSSR